MPTHQMSDNEGGVTGRERNAEHPSITELRENHRIRNALLTNNETAAILEALTALEDGLSSIPFPVGVVVALVPAESALGPQTTVDRPLARQTAT
jgi:hypothetical protein